MEQEASSAKLLSRNAGKVAVAFLAGFAVVVIISFQLRDRQAAITSSPIRKETAASPELPVLNPAISTPALFLPNLDAPLGAKTRGRKRPRREEAAPPRAIEQIAAMPVAQAPVRTATQAPRVQPVIPEAVHRIAPAESSLAIRLAKPLSTKETRTGDVFRGVLTAPVMGDGAVVFPQGSDVEGRIVESRRAGLFGRRSVLSLELTAVTTPDGHTVAVKTTQWYANGSGSRLVKVPFRGKSKENGAAQAALPENMPEYRGSDVSLPASAAVSFRLMAPAVAK